MLGSDSSSHDRSMGPPEWTHPGGTRGLGPTNPSVMSVELHTTLNEFYFFFQNHTVLGDSHIKHLIKVYDPLFLSMWDLPHM